MRSSIASERGRKFREHSCPPEIADFVRGQPLFCLEKSGTRALTSASACSNAAGKNRPQGVRAASGRGGR